MKSLRTKISILNVIAISVALIVAAIIASVSFANFAHSSTERTVELLCETGKNNLNYYFKSVEQSVKTVSTLLDNDLDETIKDDDLTNTYKKHMDFAKKVFKEASKNTNGVFSFYYRVDLDVTDATGGRETGEKGFWFLYSETTKTFEEHTVSPLDESECPWFYQPKEKGEPVWLLPYSTDNLEDVYVISYNIPVYRNVNNASKSFVGVVGIEISYNTLGEQIKDIKALSNGYAFIIENENGTIIYHPNIDLYGVSEEERPQAPKTFVDALKHGDKHVEYVYEGVAKHCYILPLGNDNMMSIVVCAPTSAVNALWLSVVTKIIIAALVLIAIFIAVTILFSHRITRPLKELTRVAEEINKGNYNVKIDYEGQDEIGVLTTTVNKLVENLSGYINDLNALAYSDALTSVHNKSAFDVRLHEIQEKIDNGEEVEFGIAIFDCDDLKAINDQFDHDKGNVYLKNSSHLICRVFQNSLVYRVGGDEFSIVLQGEDFKNREALKKYFIEKSAEICSFAKVPWEEIRVSIGIAEYDPKVDSSVKDVVVHADHLMYENKRERKKQRNK